jgi:hypothetical protein
MVKILYLVYSSMFWNVKMQMHHFSLVQMYSQNTCLELDRNL